MSIKCLSKNLFSNFKETWLDMNNTMHAMSSLVIDRTMFVYGPTDQPTDKKQYPLFFEGDGGNNNVLIFFLVLFYDCLNWVFFIVCMLHFQMCAVKKQSLLSLILFQDLTRIICHNFKYLHFRLKAANIPWKCTGM